MTRHGLCPIVNTGFGSRGRRFNLSRPKKNALDTALVFSAHRDFPVGKAPPFRRVHSVFAPDRSSDLRIYGRNLYALARGSPVRFKVCRIAAFDFGSAARNTCRGIRIPRIALPQKGNFRDARNALVRRRIRAFPRRHRRRNRGKPCGVLQHMAELGNPVVAKMLSGNARAGRALSGIRQAHSL